MLIDAELTEQIIAAAIEVHRVLGPGLLESVYEECLCHELKLRGLSYRRQIAVPVVFKDARLDCGFRIDLLVEERVVLELKAIDALEPRHDAQLMTYLKLSGKKVGLLMNFNVAMMKDGLRRKVM